VTSTFDLFSPKLGHMTGRSCWTYVDILKLIAICEKCRFRGAIATQPTLQWQPVCAPLFFGGTSVCQPPTIKLIGPPTTELLQFLTPCVTLWPWPLTSSPQVPIKAAIFTFCGVKGGQISHLIFLTPKGTTSARTTYNDVLSVGMCPKMRPVAVAKITKMNRNFHASNWLFTQTTHVDEAPWTFACLVVSGK